MQLTKVERATLVLLHNVLSKLEPENVDYHTRAIAILEDGYYEMWGDECLGHFSEPVSQEKMNYVHKIFDMYRWLQDSYKALSVEDKKKVEENNVIFKGFDGNNETELFAYARFIMGPMQRWSGLTVSDDLNTHHPTDHLYGAMLKVLPEWTARKLSAEEINAIIEARYILGEK